MELVQGQRRRQTPVHRGKANSSRVKGWCDMQQPQRYVSSPFNRLHVPFIGHRPAGRPLLQQSAYKTCLHTQTVSHVFLTCVLRLPW